jgi:hypothetical protein
MSFRIDSSRRHSSKATDFGLDERRPDFPDVCVASRGRLLNGRAQLVNPVPAAEHSTLAERPHTTLLVASLNNRLGFQLAA